ncbi:MAG: hypothetical protein M1824_006619 [Vezdaea acicularis]|nr:MAG: hypothetical protein M1824_006619 [Vezdaea acicularis]
MADPLQIMKAELEKAELEKDYMQQLLAQKTHFLDQKIAADLKRRDVYLGRNVLLEGWGVRIQEQQAAIGERKSLWRQFRRIYAQRRIRLANETQQAYDERMVFMNEVKRLLKQESIQRNEELAKLTLEKWELVMCWMSLSEDEREMNKDFDELCGEVLVMREDGVELDRKIREVDRMRAAYEVESTRVMIEGMGRLASS